MLRTRLQSNHRGMVTWPAHQTYDSTEIELYPTSHLWSRCAVLLSSATRRRWKRPADILRRPFEFSICKRIDTTHACAFCQLTTTTNSSSLTKIEGLRQNVWAHQANEGVAGSAGKSGARHSIAGSAGAPHACSFISHYDVTTY